MLPLTLVWYFGVYSLHPFHPHSPGIGTHITQLLGNINNTVKNTFLCVFPHSLYEDFSGYALYVWWSGGDIVGL